MTGETRAIIPQPDEPRETRLPKIGFGFPQPRWIGLFLLLSVALVYGGAAGNAFVAYDDDRYVYANPIITNGLSVDGIERASTRLCLPAVDRELPHYRCDGLGSEATFPATSW